MRLSKAAKRPRSEAVCGRTKAAAGERGAGAPVLADRGALGAAGRGGGRLLLLPPRRGIHVLATDRDVPEPPLLRARPLFPAEP